MVKNNYHDAVFETLLKRAVVENFENEMASIPSNEELAELYTFSKRHETRMKHLFRKERAKSYLLATAKFAKRIAAVFVVVMAILFGALLFNADVRAAVGNVIVDWYEKFTSFTFTGEKQINKSEWRPTYIPEGFEEVNVVVVGAFTDVFYTNATGIELRFTYSATLGDLNISVDNEQKQVELITIDGQDVTKVTALIPEIENGVIFQHQGYTFDIWSLIEIEELLKIAESIEIKK